MQTPIVFFYTRLWDPAQCTVSSSNNADIDGMTEADRLLSKRNEVRELSELRVGLVRALKKEFGKFFIGGIQPDEFAQENFSDLLGENISSRRKYTAFLKKSRYLCKY